MTITITLNIINYYSHAVWQNTEQSSRNITH